MAVWFEKKWKDKKKDLTILLLQVILLFSRKQKTQLRSRGSVRKCEQVCGADATFACTPVFIPALLLRTVTARIVALKLIDRHPYKNSRCYTNDAYLTIIPRTRMGSESIAHGAEGRMGYWLRGHEGERNNYFSKIQLVGQKYRDKTVLASKTRFSRHCFGFQSRRFLLLVGYNI